MKKRTFLPGIIAAALTTFVLISSSTNARGQNYSFAWKDPVVNQEYPTNAIPYELRVCSEIRIRT